MPITKMVYWEHDIFILYNFYCCLMKLKMDFSTVCLKKSNYTTRQHIFQVDISIAKNSLALWPKDLVIT